MRTAPRRGSIRRRVTATAFLLLALLSAALLAAAWESAGRASADAFDRVIGASAMSIADSLRVNEGRIEAEIPQAALGMIGLQSEARVFYRVAGPSGDIITGQVTLGLDLPAAAATEPAFSTGAFRGAPVRFALVGRYFDNGWASVIVAETLESRRAVALRLFFPSLAAVLIVVGIAVTLIFLGLKRAFRPLALIEDELRIRAPTDLAPIAAAAPREVSGLVAALDEFMGRLAETLERVQNYASHAAHEVRTPIAAIRAQAAAAQAEPTLAGVRRRLRRIEANAEAAGQIVNQMLLDASLQHRLGTEPAGAIDLAQICREVIDRLDPLLQPAVRLIVDAKDGGRCVAEGDFVAVREAVRNLLDNALKYAPSGLILMTIRPNAAGWEVEVSDTGPGIPEGMMGRMTERFSRGGAAPEIAGAGLGLHIVRKVADAYGGELALANRPEGGLSARLTLRKAAAAGLVALLALSQPNEAAKAQPASPTVELRLLAGPERGLLEPLIAGFGRDRPDVRVVMERIDSQLAFSRVQSEAALGRSPDLVIGHPADVLVEMVNDGYAGAGLAVLAPLAPAWASWRRELLTYALDEGVFVYRRAAFPDDDLPRNRGDLVRLLDRRGERLRNRVGVLDVGNNGMAYLLASQEARLSTSYWRLIRAFGSVEARIYWSTREVAEALARGEIDIAYNAIASELAGLRGDDRFVVLTADDFRLVMPRAAFVPRQARSVEAAQAFMRFALSPTGQAIVEANHAGAIISAGGRPAASLQRIGIGPGLLALRDLNTRSTLMETWLQLILTR